MTEFGKYLTQCPHALNSKTGTLGLLKDALQNDMPKFRVLQAAYELGILDALRKSNPLTAEDRMRILTGLSSQYAMTDSAAQKAVAYWQESITPDILKNAEKEQVSCPILPQVPHLLHHPKGKVSTFLQIVRRLLAYRRTQSALVYAFNGKGSPACGAMKYGVQRKMNLRFLLNLVVFRFLVIRILMLPKGVFILMLCEASSAAKIKHILLVRMICNLQRQSENPLSNLSKPHPVNRGSSLHGALCLVLPAISSRNVIPLEMTGFNWRSFRLT